MQFHKWEVCCASARVYARLPISRDSLLPLPCPSRIAYRCLPDPSSNHPNSLKQIFRSSIRYLIIPFPLFNKSRRERKKIYFINKIYSIYFHLAPMIFQKSSFFTNNRREPIIQKKESNLRLEFSGKKRKEEFRFPLPINRDPAVFGIRLRSTQKESIGY